VPENTVEIYLKGVDQGASSAINGVLDSVRGLMAGMAGLGAGLGFAALIKQGIEFNKTMEDSRTGLGALILASHEFSTRNGAAATTQASITKALEMTREVQAGLLEDSRKTAASYTSLTQAFQTAYGPAMAAGVTNLSKLREVTVSASLAVNALGLNSNQLQQEIRALFTGEQGPDNTLTRVLGITGEELRKVKNSGGDVADFLIQKLKPFMDMAGVSSKNFSTLLSNLGDTMDQVLGKATAHAFDAMKDGLSGTMDQLGGTKDATIAIGDALGEMAEKLKPAIAASVEFGISLAKAAADAGSKLGETNGILVKTFGILTTINDALGGWLIAGGLLALPFMGLLGTFTKIGAAAVKVWSAAAIMESVGAVSAFFGATTSLSAAVLAFPGAAIFTLTGLKIWEAVTAMAELNRETEKAKNANKAAGEGMLDEIAKRAARLKAERDALPGPDLPSSQRSNAAALLSNAAAWAKSDLATLGYVSDSTTAIYRAAMEAAKPYIGVLDDLTKAKAKDVAKTKELVEAEAKAAAEVAKTREQFSKWADDLLSHTISGSLVGQEKALFEANEKTKKLQSELTTFEKTQHGIRVLDTQEMVNAQAAIEQRGFQLRLESLKGFAKSYIAIAPSLDKPWNEATTGGEGKVEKTWGLTDGDRQKLKDQADEIVAANGGMVNGLQAGWLRYRTTVATMTESAAEFATNTFASISRGFETGIYDVISGKAKDLGDVLKGIWDDVLKGFARLVSQMVERWLWGGEAMKAGGVLGAILPSGGLTASGTARDPMQGNVDANGNLYGAGGGGGAGWAGYLGAGAAGYGIGSMIGGGGTGNMIGGAIGGIGGMLAGSGGALLGLKLGVLAGPVGMIVGAIVGAIIGGLFNKSTEMDVGTVGNEFLAKGVAKDKSGEAILDTVGPLQGNIGNMFRAAGQPSQMGLVSKMFQEYLANMNFSSHAGSNEDLTNNVRQLITGQIPRELMHAMFGQKGEIKPGDNAFGTTGTSSNWSAVDLLGQPGPKGSTQSAPLVQLFRDLGFTLPKIQELADMIDVKTPEELTSYFQTLIGVVVAAKDLGAKMNQDRAGIYADIEKARTEAPQVGFQKSADAIKSQLQEVGLYTGDEKLKKAQEALQAVQNLRDAEYAAIVRIKDVQDKLTASLDSQIATLGGKDYQKDQGWLDADTAAKTQEAAAKAKAALTLDDIQKYAQEAQSGAAGLVNGLITIWQRARDLLTSVNDTKGLFEKTYEESAAKPNTAGQYQLDVIKLQYDYAEAAKLSGQEQLDALAAVNQAAGEMYNRQLAMIGELRANSEALAASVKDFKWQMDYDQQTTGAGKVGMIQSEVEKLMAGLATADSAGQLKGGTDQIQAMLKTYWGLFGADDPRRAEASDWIKKILDDMAAAASARSAALENQLGASNAQIWATLDGAAGTLAATMGTTATQIDEWRTFLVDLRSSIADKLNGMVDDIVAVNLGLAAEIENLRLLFTTLYGPGNASPSPSSGDPPPLHDLPPPGQRDIDQAAAAFNAALTACGTGIADFEAKVRSAGSRLDGLLANRDAGATVPDASPSYTPTAPTVVRSQPSRVLRPRTA
jgi:hypothetical protein